MQSKKTLEPFFLSKQDLNKPDLYSRLAGWCSKLNTSHERKRQFQRKAFANTALGRNKIKEQIGCTRLSPEEKHRHVYIHFKMYIDTHFQLALQLRVVHQRHA